MFQKQVTVEQWYYQNVQYVAVKNQDLLKDYLGIKTPLSKVLILGNILFWMHIKMNKIVNKFLLAGDKFMPEMHLKQPGLTYSACEPFTKNK